MLMLLSSINSFAEKNNYLDLGLGTTNNNSVPMISLYYGHKLTIERSIHEDAKEPGCFDCHLPMARVYDAPGIQFKGRGFYSTGG